MIHDVNEKDEVSQCALYILLFFRISSRVCSLGNMNVFTLDLNMPASQERLHGLWPGDRPSMRSEA